MFASIDLRIARAPCCQPYRVHAVTLPFSSALGFVQNGPVYDDISQAMIVPIKTQNDINMLEGYSIPPRQLVRV
jgi:hypothetical protein